MKNARLVALLFLTLLGSLRADTASHRQAADDILSLISGPEMFRAGFETFLGPMLENMRQNGVPEAQLKEIEAAFKDWLDKDIKWDELKPRMVDIYVQEFTEAELKEILVFYKSPVGAKALKRLPALMAEGGKVGQEYAKTKEAALEARIRKIMEKASP